MAKFAFRPFLSWRKILFFWLYTTIFAEVTQVEAYNHVLKFQTCMKSGFWVMMVQTLKKTLIFSSMFLLNIECFFFKIWIIITQKPLFMQVWNFSTWLYASTWVTSAKMVVYNQRNRILRQLKNGQNANFADFALTNKLWM